MPSFRLIVVCSLYLLAAATARVEGQSLRFDLSGDVTLDEVDAVVRGHLQRVEALAANRRWDEVIETLRQVTDNRGDRVIAVVPGYYVRLRDYCHRRLAALPPEALAIYRDQVDGQAETWFEQAAANRDPRRLRMILDQFYCSSRGDDALRLLGDEALERGDFGAARGYWQQLLETPPTVVAADAMAAVQADATLTADERALIERYYVHREASKTYVLLAAKSIDPDLSRLAAVMRSRGVVGPRLAYPQGDMSQSDVYARLILVNILEGSRDWAAEGIRDLKAVYPEARGRLGGREVNFVEALETLLAESRTWPERRRGDDWPTFAGNAARNRVQPIDFDVGRVRWRAPLGAVPAGDHDYPARRTMEDRRTLLSYWPIVIGGNVFVADGGSVRGYKLATGEPAWGDSPVVYPSDGRPEQTDVEQAFSSRPTIGVPRYTLTAHGDRLYARLGRPVTSAVIDGGFRGPTSSIICLSLKTEGTLLWSAHPPEGDRWAFEGPPIADDDFVYVGLRKGGVRPQSHLACYDAETGTMQWRRMICSAETPGQGSFDEITHNLPTLVGDVIYYNTNLGAVAAVSKHDGEIRWIVTYPRSTGADLNQRAVHFYRDLTPCVYDRGTVFVAPSDGRQILALDADSGLLRWETSLADDVVHLLGTSDDYLAAAGERQWWIHEQSGRIAYVWPDESPKGFGRGTLVGDVVLRPTRTTIEVLGMADGRRRREIELTTRAAGGGNLVAVDDSLLITTGNELIVFDRHGGSSSASASESGSASFRVPYNPRVDE